MTKGKQTSAPPVVRPIEHEPLAQYVERAYLNYSMYVILDRALPQLADGLKPVQRRIIYAMSELGLRSGAKYKKSARTIGDVIGKFHPHGDVACYEAMVLMAQPFATRYCLVDGQGNWGSMDDAKSFAAMRYTEARLTPYAQLLLSELNRATMEWQPNFDGTLEEPVILPARVPNILLNGASGIAVGMTTEIPSHNLSEVMDACLLLLDKPDLSEYIAKKKKMTESELKRARHRAIKQIIKKIPSPDFASGGSIISSQDELIAAYTSGNGNIKVRCKYDINGTDAVITQLPPQTSTIKIIEQLQQQIQSKKLPMVTEIRDESDSETPVRLVLATRKGTDRQRLMAHLFATTDLEKGVRINLNVIGTDGKPAIWALNELLYSWLEFRRSCVIERLENQLSQVNERLHILAGLLIAYLDLDKVIAIIRNEDEPKPVLIKKFSLSDKQAEAILETKLRHLAKLEEEKIKGEEEELTDKKYYLESTLKSKQKITDFIKKEFNEIKQEYGDDRRSEIHSEDKEIPAAKTFKHEHIVSREAATLVVSQKGWVRLAKGHDINPREFTYREGDGFLCSSEGDNNLFAIFMDSHGRGYSLSAYDLPSARGLGEPLTSRLDIADGAQIQAGVLITPKEELLLVAGDGNGFIVNEEDVLAVNRKRGKQIMNIKSGAGMIQPVKVVEGMLKVACLTEKNRLLILPAEDIPRMGRGRGVRLINPAYPKDRVKQAVIIKKGDTLAINDAGNQVALLTSTDMGKYRARRGAKGKLLGKGFSERVEIVPVSSDATAVPMSPKSSV